MLPHVGYSARQLSLSLARRRPFLCGVCSLSTVPDKSVKEAAVNPLKEYTFLGGIKKPDKGVFHYTDRKSGVGYSDYSNTVYQHRPYIWPPLRKLFNFNFVLVVLLMIGISIDYEGVLNRFNEATRSWRPEASQIKTKEGQ